MVLIDILKDFASLTFKIRFARLVRNVLVKDPFGKTFCDMHHLTSVRPCSSPKGAKGACCLLEMLL